MLQNAEKNKATASLPYQIILNISDSRFTTCTQVSRETKPYIKH
ncbi:hypothetical protein HMPREF1870_01560 [Bacteroidales bacterium KA00344]|nr:hypothetical protein HMPREF1870_01560 [Bacteroidales bacterium KA00344]